jgi:hypothetical protein
MYNLTKNNYHLKPKNSNIQTPLEVSQFIFELLRDKGKFRKKNKLLLLTLVLVKGIYPPISSIISLPTTGIFEKVDFFTEILIFNIKGLAPHYFYQPNHE